MDEASKAYFDGYVAKRVKEIKGKSSLTEQLDPARNRLKLL